KLESSRNQRLRRVLLVVSLAANVGMLAYFKYANFFLRSLEEGLQLAGLQTTLPVLSVLLPIGISFYTFEAINYVVDVYRRRIPAERALGHFMLFILFFPHLIAGPIVRARDFLPQIRRRKRWDWARLNLGLRFFLLGLFKKFVIADRMALFADPIFASPGAFNTAALWMGAFAYALQVYADFSGYTDMALGTAHMLGYKLAPNFNMPYLSANIAEFWRRWHMSLSSWLRDYLFIPLGGSRGSRWQTYRNLMLVMTIGGLWHGASWPFVIFGVIQGGMLVMHRAFRQCCESRPALSEALLTIPGTALRVAFTFTIFTCSLVVFRSTTLALGWTMLKGMLLGNGGLPTPLVAWSLGFTFAVVAVGHALGQRQLWQRLAARVPSPIRGLGYAALLLMAIVLGPTTSKAFIYFQF
ncbi:MAG TPA: MBOAT family O-acyltransferase, partial [Gemmataceae bacterium]|nr:MBOAT family O-acyltransferase [Gemmataceae bacterium]